MRHCHQISQRLAQEAAKLPWPFRDKQVILRAPIAGDHDYGGVSGAPVKRKATPGKPVTANRIHRYAAVVRAAAVFACLAGISLAARPIGGEVVSDSTVGTSVQSAAFDSPASGTTTAAAPIALGISGADTSSDPVGLNAYENVVGHAPADDMFFQDWSEPLYYTSQMSALKGAGITPIITWEPELSTGGIPLSQIAAGDYDGYITASAKLAVAWKGTVFIRFAHEMNLPGSLFGNGIPGQTPADYIAAWRHVVTIFRENGATNVQWVWSPNVNCNGQCPFTQFYPGNSYVNWVGLDGYNYGPSLGSPWTSLLNVFQGSYAAITALTSKPLMIAETASAEIGGSKAAWITQGFLTDIPTYLPRVRAVVWFNRVKETDWRVNSSATSLAAWKTVVSSPLYAGNLHS
jgi:hypothetical protein